jgi:hypothetical protein
MNLQNEDFHQSFHDKAVIMPPESKPNYELHKRFTRVVVDSKDRDKTLFSNPNDYEVKFDDDIEDVISAQLLNINIPLSQYLVNKYFNSLSVSLNGGESREITLVQGNYTEEQLASHTTTVLNTVFGGNEFTVTYLPNTDNYIFACKSPFQLVFKDSTAKLFGCSEAITYSSTHTGSTPFVHSFTSPFRKDFKYNNYIIMSIDQFDINKSTNNTLNRSFAILTKNYQSMNMCDDPQIVKYFSPTLSRLSKLRVRFFDRYGNPYDFNNMDHHFEIRFESFKQKRKYQSIFFDR